MCCYILGSGLVEVVVVMVSARQSEGSIVRRSPVSVRVRIRVRASFSFS